MLIKIVLILEKMNFIINKIRKYLFITILYFLLATIFFNSLIVFAKDIVIEAPTTTPINIDTAGSNKNGTDSITIDINATLETTSTNTPAINAVSSSGAITINVNADVKPKNGHEAINASAVSPNNPYWLNQAGTGDISVNGSGAINGTTAINTIGNINFSNTGSGTNQRLEIAARTYDWKDYDSMFGAPKPLTPINFNSGNVIIRNTGNFQSGIDVTQSGNGNVLIENIGSVGNGNSSNSSGISIVAIRDTFPANGGINFPVGGNIDIGGNNGLNHSVTGTTGLNGAIYADAMGNGTVRVKTTTGGILNGGIRTAAQNGSITLDIGADINGGSYGIFSATTGAGATTIDLRSGTRVSGSNNAIAIATKNGNVTVNNSGTVKGSIEGERYTNGTGVFTFNNSGTVDLVFGKSVTGFDSFLNKNGGVLTGTGNFGTVIAESGSFIRPGDRSLPPVNNAPQMGTMKMSNLTMAAGATLEIRIDASNDNDLLNVTNTAALNRSNLLIKGSPNDKTAWTTVFENQTKFTVLTAKSLIGTFDTVSTDRAFLQANIDYSTANQVDVAFKRNDVNYESVATTECELAVATTLQNAVNSNALSGTAQQLINKIDANVSTDQANNAFNILSGAGSLYGQSMAILNSGRFLNAVNNQIRTSLGSAGVSDFQSGFSTDANNTRLQRISTRQNAQTAVKPIGAQQRAGRAWASSLAGLSKATSKCSRSVMTGDDIGGLVGYDQIIAPGVRAGFAIGGSVSNFSVSSLATKGNLDSGFFSLFAAAESGPAYLLGSLGYSAFEHESYRTISGIGASETWQGKYRTDVFSGSIEMGYRSQLGDYLMIPFAGVGISLLRQDAYSEKGNDSQSVFGLSYPQTFGRSLPVTIGVQSEVDFGESGGWQIFGLGRFAWIHEFETSRSLNTSFNNLPGMLFKTAGADIDANRSQLTAGLNLVNAKNSMLVAGFSGTIDSATRTSVLQADYRYTW